MSYITQFCKVLYGCAELRDGFVSRVQRISVECVRFWCFQNYIACKDHIGKCYINFYNTIHTIHTLHYIVFDALLCFFNYTATRQNSAFSNKYQKVKHCYA